MLRETLAALQLKVTIGDKTETVSLRPGDLVRFEEKFNRSLIGDVDANGDPLAAKFGLTELMFMAWLGAKRSGLTDLDFDEFLDEDIDVDMGDKAPAGSLGKDTSPA
jgi:hypothetical protein